MSLVSYKSEEIPGTTYIAIANNERIKIDENLTDEL